MKKFIAILLCASIITALSACTIELNGNRLDIGSETGLPGTTLTEDDMLLQGAAGLQNLVIDSKAGDINVVRTDGSEIKVSFTKKVKGISEDRKKEIMDNIKVAAEKNGKKLTVHAETRDGGGSDLWDWVRRKHPAYSVTIDYELEVPENIKVFTIRSTAGNIWLEEVTGSLDIRTNAGNVTLEGVSLIDDNNIELNAGNIKIDGTVKNAAGLDVDITAGNITLVVPEDEKFNLDASLKAGNISGGMISKPRMGGGSLSEEINGGGPRVRLKLNAGNIIVNRK